MVAQLKTIEPEEPWGSLSDEEQETVELKAKGWKQKDIAAEQAIHRTTVYRRLEKADAQKYLRHLRHERTSESKALIAEATNVSLYTVMEAAEGGDAKIALGWLALAPSYWKGGIGTI